MAVCLFCLFFFFCLFFCHSRAGGNPIFFLVIPAFAGMIKEKGKEKEKNMGKMPMGHMDGTSMLRTTAEGPEVMYRDGAHLFFFVIRH